MECLNENFRHSFFIPAINIFRSSLLKEEIYYDGI